MDKITAIGLDLAKQIIQVHAIDAAGRVVLRKVVRRERLLALLAQFPRCVVGMEACSGAHHWARELTQLGRPVLLGASRKSFLGGLSGKPAAERLTGSTAAATVAALHGAALVRVHDVAATREALAVVDAVSSSSS